MVSRSQYTAPMTSPTDERTALYITKEAAAKILERGCRTVELYAKRGILSKVRKGRRVFFFRDEVARLKDHMDEGNGATVSKEEFSQLQLRLRKLEAEMSLVLRMLEARRHIPMSDSELLALYNKAQQEVESEYSLDDLLRWYQVFDNLTDEDLSRVANLAHTSRPWYPFHRLCCDMVTWLHDHPHFSVTLDMQRAHALLLRARRTMRNRIMLQLDGAPSETYTQIFGERPDPKEDLFRLLG